MATTLHDRDSGIAAMDAVFSNRDLVLQTLSSFLEEYRQEGPGCPQTHSPTEMARRARVAMRSLLTALQAMSRVNTMFHAVAAVVLSDLLERINEQFAQMRSTTLRFLYDAPETYVGVAHPIVDRQEAIRIYSNDPIGKRALEPVRACFEEPLDPRPRPLLGLYRCAEREAYGRRCCDAGHWTRSWVQELTWISPPTQDVGALWLALHRGCSVCGGVCRCETHRAMLERAATNADLTSPLLPNHSMSLSCAPDKSIYTRLHARIRVPWDLKPVSEAYMRPMTATEPYRYTSPIVALATRVWMYTHPDHIVSLLIDNEPRPGYECPRILIDWHGSHHTPNTSIEALIHMKLVLARTKNITVGGAPFVNALMTRLIDARMRSLQTSGLREELLKQCPAWFNQYYAQKALTWPTCFHASLPLFPAHGKPREHSWMHVFGFTEQQFLDASWQANLPLPPTATQLAEVATVEEVEKWRKHAFFRAIMALSEALPNRCTAFHREVEILHPDQWHDGSGLGRENPNREAPQIEVCDLCILSFGSMADENHYLRDDNWLLLESWKPLKMLRHSIVDKGEAFENILHMYQSPPEWHYQRLPADPAMIEYFSRLDSVLGMTWKEVSRMEDYSFHRQTCPSTIQIELKDIVVAYLNKTRTMAPPSPWDMPVFGRLPPPGPRHSDVLMRWWIRALMHPSKTEARRPADPWPCTISLTHHNTFVCIDPKHPEAPKAPHSDRFDCGVLAVHLSLSVTTPIRYDLTQPMIHQQYRNHHLRITMGLRLEQLFMLFYSMKLPLSSRFKTNVNDAVDTRSCEHRSFASWHQEATKCCEALTTFVQRDVKGQGQNAVWLLHCILGSHWTPVLKLQNESDVFDGECHNWVEGWHALSSLCTPTSAWFCDVHSTVPFCKWRGCSQCVCRCQCSV